MSNEASRHIAAADVAIQAAVKSDPTMRFDDLVSAIVAIASTSGVNMRILARRLMVDVVRIVGADEAHQFVELVNVARNKRLD